VDVQPSFYCGAITLVVPPQLAEAATTMVPVGVRAIPGHQGDVKDGMMKRPRVLWRAGLAPSLIGGWSRPGRGGSMGNG
jgi:hypothetical protein